MLKLTDVQLDHLSDITLYSFREKDTRGAVSYKLKSSSITSRKHVKSSDEGKSSKHITYQDTNNLYELAISQFLPFGGFKITGKLDVNAI